MAVVNLNTRWSFSSISSLLPSGKDSDSFAVKCFLEVYDAAGGVSTTTLVVIVRPSPASLNLDQVTRMIDSISGASRSTDYKLSLLSALSLSFSRVTCISAPNCALLNRQPCDLTANTCGSCITGYTKNEVCRYFVLGQNTAILLLCSPLSQRTEKRVFLP